MPHAHRLAEGPIYPFSLMRQKAPNVLNTYILVFVILGESIVSQVKRSHHGRVRGVNITSALLQLASSRGGKVISGSDGSSFKVAIVDIMVRLCGSYVVRYG
jgi:hypothetical protein